MGIAPVDWTCARVAHLIERAGFGATPEQIAEVAALTPQQAVDRLVDYDTIENSAHGPFDESGIWDSGMNPFGTVKLANTARFSPSARSARARSAGARHRIPRDERLASQQPVVTSSQ